MGKPHGQVYVLLHNMAQDQYLAFGHSVQQANNSRVHAEIQCNPYSRFHSSLLMRIECTSLLKALTYIGGLIHITVRHFVMLNSVQLLKFTWKSVTL